MMNQTTAKTTIILAHPTLKNSIANKTIITKVQNGLENVEVRNIAELYPDYQIDVEAEQKALLESDIIVFQFPFYWYSVPAILKQWMDNVLSYNFAYGREGDKLKGKAFIVSSTVGGPQEAYSPTGYNHFRIADLLHPLEQTAYLAQMDFRPPVIGHGMIFIPGAYNTREEVEVRASEQAERLLKAIKEAVPQPVE